jgi:putative ABC transport system permease protein
MRWQRCVLPCDIAPDNRERRCLATLKNAPDGVLASDETVNDFQLSLGDTINRRLQPAVDHQYHPVPFRFIGIVREFPTAPRDSFLVANADYVARTSKNRPRRE